MKITIFYLFLVMLMFLPSITHTRAAAASTLYTDKVSSVAIDYVGFISQTKIYENKFRHISTQKRVKDCRWSSTFFVGSLTVTIGYTSIRGVGTMFYIYIKGVGFYPFVIDYAIC